tara:strand:+ start:239 stop:502 length:264 start_codon:yes stop_codon:yes gene_type:complete
MQKDIQELLIILNKFNQKNFVDTNSELEKRFYVLISKIKDVISTKSNLRDIESQIPQLEDILEKISNRQKEKLKLFDEFKNYLKKNK